jgi:phosphate transport system substrate-binding protein
MDSNTVARGRGSALVFSWAFLLGLGLFGVGAADAADLRIHGSNTIGERLMPALVTAWLETEGATGLQQQPIALDELSVLARRDGANIEIELHSHGSSTGIAGLLAGRIDLAMSSRPLTPSESAQLTGVEEGVLALDGLAVIVPPSQTLAQLDLMTLRRVFNGELRDWSELGGRGGRISLHARDERSGTWDTFRSLVMGERTLSPAARRYESTEALAAAVAADPNAIGFVGLSGLKGVRALAISDGAGARPPEVGEVAVEDYALSRRLYLYLPSAAAPAARRLLEFALSDAGQRIVEAEGFVSQRVRRYASPPQAGYPQDYLDLVAGAQRLSLNFRFADGSARLDSKADSDLLRLADFMRRPDNRSRELILIGFSDANEVVPVQAEVLSNDRADHVADRMAEVGLHPRRVRGMGGSVLLSADDSARGRARNRRVEVWVR